MVTSAHVTDADIEAFCGQALPARALVRFTDHLQQCADCRRRTAARRDRTAAHAALDQALAAWDVHVSPEDLSAFVDGTLSTERRADVSSHCDQCAACADDVADLEAFAQTGATGRRRWRTARFGTVFAVAASLIVLAGAAGLRFVLRPSARVDVRQTSGPAATREPVAADRFAGLDNTDRDRVLRARTTGRLSIPAAVTALAGRRGALLGDAPDQLFRVVAPIATEVLETQPALRWTAAAGAEHYVVTLRDAGGHVFSSPPLTGLQWMPDRRLTRGMRYTWQVAATGRGRERLSPAPPDPPAAFVVATAADAERLARLPGDPFVRGVILAEAGVLDEAERDLTRAAGTGADADLAAALLAQLRRARVPR